ncbi:MAG: DUF547 domain-containing protein [Myxococcota bacterium]
MTPQPGRRNFRRWTALVVMGLVLGAIAIVTIRALGVTAVVVDADPIGQPRDHFDFRWWNRALGRYVKGDRVDYAVVLDEVPQLDRFWAALGQYGPQSTPERFTTSNQKLAFYINAYNALTLLGVVRHWPIDSVQDVHGWLEPRPGFGFFYGLRFELDGHRTNLYDLENEVIRGFRDARIHAAINCASISCPPLAPKAFEGRKLDAQLDQVTHAFCSSPAHVRVDVPTRQIQLSAIFDWYRTDFEEHARRLGLPPTLLAFVQAFANDEVREALDKAQAEGYEVAFLEYNWSLNRL